MAVRPYVTELLQRARSRISDPKRWTQRELAHTALGWPADPEGPAAAEWCAIGALRAEAHLAGSHRGVLAATIRLAKAIGKTCQRDVMEFNDRHTHDTVLEMFDTAIRQK